LEAPVADTEELEHEAPHRAAGGGLSRKWHGVPLWGWTLGGTVAAVVVLKWWRGRSSGSAGSSSSGTGTSTVQNCYDISGALVPCAQAAANNASGAGDLGGTLGGIYTGSSGSGTSTGTGTGTSGGTSSTTTSTGTTAPSSGRLTAPMGLHLTNKGKTGVRVNWIKVPGATGYVALCKKGGANGKTVNGPFNVSASQTFANFGSLAPGTGYTAFVWPSSSTVEGGPGSNQPHAEFAFTTSK
jgi:hypothetical protein